MTNGTTNESRTTSMKLMAVTALAVAFISGGIIGGLVINLYNRAHPGQFVSGGPHPHGDRPGGPGSGPGGLIGQFQTELQLTDDQTRQVKDILDKSRDQMTQLRTQTRPQFMAIREQTESQIRAILNPEQQKKFDEMSKKKEEREKKNEQNREGPHPH